MTNTLTCSVTVYRHIPKQGRDTLKDTVSLNFYKTYRFYCYLSEYFLMNCYTKRVWGHSKLITVKP